MIATIVKGVLGRWSILVNDEPIAEEFETFTDAWNCLEHHKKEKGRIKATVAHIRDGGK